MIHHQGANNLLLFILLIIGVLFEAKIWPDKRKIQADDYSYVQLDSVQMTKAIDKARLEIHLENVGYYKRPILFNDIRIPIKTFVYYLLEHWRDLVLAGLLAYYLRGTFVLFFGLCIIDFIDFLCTYNEVYSFHGLPISVNTISVIVFGLVILNEWKKQLQ